MECYWNRRMNCSGHTELSRAVRILNRGYDVSISQHGPHLMSNRPSTHRRSDEATSQHRFSYIHFRGMRHHHPWNCALDRGRKIAFLGREHANEDTPMMSKPQPHCSVCQDPQSIIQPYGTPLSIHHVDTTRAHRT